MSDISTLRVGATTESPLEASKWLEVQVLIDETELTELFASLADFQLFYCGSVLQRDTGAVDPGVFIGLYKEYIDTLKEGKIPDMSHYRKALSPAMTVDSEALYRVLIGSDKEIVRQSRPVVQLQANTISYSDRDKKFHPMAFGADNIAWGIQFSYPQLYRDPSTKLVEQVKESPTFPNTAVFHMIQKWIRKTTIPTPFMVDGQLTNVPIRLGKKCLAWINHHPQLVQKGISVKLTENLK